MVNNMKTFPFVVTLTFLFAQEIFYW